MSSPKVKKPLIVILGPTASGKSEMATKLAKKLALSKIEGFNGVEIVSADSRQVYKEMNIGTAKPFRYSSPNPKSPPTPRLWRASKIQNPKLKPSIIKGIPHYLIDVIYPNQDFNVAIYKKLAIKAIKDIQKRGKLPFLVGGTGLYIQAIVDNIDFPAVPPQKKLRAKLEKKSAKELFKIYKKLDPEGAKFIEKENKRRLIRAIEVYRVTGKSFWQQRKKGAKLLFDVLQIGIKIPKAELEKRIKRRVEKMFRMGLEEEVKNLVQKYGWGIPLFQTIGYQEFRDYFDEKTKIEEIKKLIEQHTIQFARRQMTWFKKDNRIMWITGYRKAEKVVKEFLK